MQNRMHFAIEMIGRSKYLPHNTRWYFWLLIFCLEIPCDESGNLLAPEEITNPHHWVLPSILAMAIKPLNGVDPDTAVHPDDGDVVS